MLCFYHFTLYAQGSGALAKMDKLFSQAARVRTIQTQLPRPIKYGNFPPPTQYNKQFAHMEKIVQRQIIAKQPGSVNLVNYTHKRYATEKYQQVMNNFIAFKHHTDPFLYYQTKDKRPLPPQETRQWLARIYNLKQQLASLRTIVSVQEESLQHAYNYLNEVLRAVAPDVALLTVPQPYQERQDRVYKEEEFFLRPPEHNPLLRALQHIGIATGGVKALPKNLKIAVFNDNNFAINDLKKQQQAGKLFPTNDVLFSNDSQGLLQQIHKQIFVPDVIITDICSSVAPNGISLTQELRNIGYNGVILALTQYPEKEIDGKRFMEYGFDGVISSADIRKAAVIRTRMLQALQYHFYYRDLHGWIR